VGKSNSRSALLGKGLLLSLVPVGLAYPGMEFLTVCPPTYASMGVRVMSSAILVSELWALRKLIACLNIKYDGKIDTVNLLSWAASTVAVLVVTLCVFPLALRDPREY